HHQSRWMSLRWSRPSLSRLRGGTHPLADPTCEPRPLDQDGRIRRLDRWMPGEFLAPGRQTDSQDNQASVSRFAGQTETQDSRPYAPNRVTGWDGGQTHNLILHADY